MFGLPPSTLKDRLSGRVLHGRKPVPVPYLLPDEEDELEDFVPVKSDITRPVANSSAVGKYSPSILKRLDMVGF